MILGMILGTRTKITISRKFRLLKDVPESTTNFGTFGMKAEKIDEIEISKIKEFPNHPFKVVEDYKMNSIGIRNSIR